MTITLKAIKPHSKVGEYLDTGSREWVHLWHLVCDLGDDLIPPDAAVAGYKNDRAQVDAAVSKQLAELLRHDGVLGPALLRHRRVCAAQVDDFVEFLEQCGGFRIY